MTVEIIQYNVIPVSEIYMPSELIISGDFHKFLISLFCTFPYMMIITLIRAKLFLTLKNTKAKQKNSFTFVFIV